MQKQYAHFNKYLIIDKNCPIHNKKIQEHSSNTKQICICIERFEKSKIESPIPDLPYTTAPAFEFEENCIGSGVKKVNQTDSNMFRRTTQPKTKPDTDINALDDPKKKDTEMDDTKTDDTKKEDTKKDENQKDDNKKEDTETIAVFSKPVIDDDEIPGCHDDDVIHPNTLNKFGSYPLDIRGSNSDPGLNLPGAKSEDSCCTVPSVTDIINKARQTFYEKEAKLLTQCTLKTLIKDVMCRFKSWIMGDEPIKARRIECDHDLFDSTESDDDDTDDDDITIPETSISLPQMTSVYMHD